MGPRSSLTLRRAGFASAIVAMLSCDPRREDGEVQEVSDAGWSDSSGTGPVQEHELAFGASPPDCGAGRRVPIASGLRIREIALYQTVKVSLYADGVWVAARHAPVVQGKRALVRVFVDMLAGYRPRPVRGTLILQQGDTATTLSDERALFANSTDQLRASTFNFKVPGELLGPDTALRVELQERDCNAPTSETTDAVLPSGEGAQPLQAEALGKLRVTVVPISMQGRLPLTSERELVSIRDALAAYYPVPSVELSVRRSLVASGGIPPGDEKAWSDMLNEILRARMDDRVGDDVYYLGLMQPAATYQDYCARSCQLGLAPHVTVRDPIHQVALVASFADAQTYESIAHEIGHAHGRGHAPCTSGLLPAGIDPNFPDETGATATWGWDSRTDELLPPTAKDIMGYCKSNWISAYHYNLIAERSREVNVPSSAAIEKTAPHLARQLVLYGDGSARWGAQIEQPAPSGELERADAFDAQGRVVARFEVGRVSLSHSGTQLLYLPELDPSWARIALAGRELSLASVLPAR